MSHIGDLIHQLSPSGVKFKALGEIGEFIRGNGLQKSDLIDHGAPAIHYGQIHTFYGTWTRTTKSFTDPALASRLRRAKPGDLIIATTSEDDAAVAKATAWIGEGEVAVSGDAYIYRHSIEPRYAAYFFQSEDFQAQKAKHITGTKVRRVSGEALAKIRIPIPPLEVQDEIVRILDRFADLERQLEVELEAELEARRVQYSFYRTSLLTFADNVERVPLGSAISIKFGARITKANDAGTLYPVFGGGGESFRTDAFNRENDWVVSRFAMSENCVRRVEGKFWMLDSGFTFDTTRPDIEKDYVGQVLLSLQPLIFGTSTQSAQKNIDIEGFKRLTIPIPKISEQHRIVGILTRFEAVVDQLSVGLPAERRARRQQYEYYRDKLLTFEESTA